MDSTKTKILIICFLKRVKKEITKYLKDRNILSEDYDYIGYEESRLNGEHIKIKGGTRSKKLMNLVNDVNYKYDLIFYEFCPILPDKPKYLLTDFSVLILKNKLNTDGKFVFMTGKPKYYFLKKELKKYGFYYNIIDETIIEFSLSPYETKSILSKIREISTKEYKILVFNSDHQLEKDIIKYLEKHEIFSFKEEYIETSDIINDDTTDHRSVYQKTLNLLDDKYYDLVIYKKSSVPVEEKKVCYFGQLIRKLISLEGRIVEF